MEEQIVDRLIEGMAQMGYRVRCVDYGDARVRVHTKEEAIEAVFAVDDCQLEFVKDDEHLRTHFLLVLGEGEDIIANYNTNEATEFAYHYAMEGLPL